MNQKVGGGLTSIGRTLSFCSTRSRSSSQAPSHTGSGMDINPPSPTKHHTLSSSSQQEERCPSARISRLPRTVYTGADSAPSGPAHFYYTNFDDPGASHKPHQSWSTNSGWEDQATYEQGEPSTSTG